MTYTLEFTNSRDVNPSTPSITVSRWSNYEDATGALDEFAGSWVEFEVGLVVSTQDRREVSLNDRELAVFVVQE